MRTGNGLDMIRVAHYPEGIALLCERCTAQIMPPARGVQKLAELIERAMLHVQQHTPDAQVTVVRPEDLGPQRPDLSDVLWQRLSAAYVAEQAQNLRDRTALDAWQRRVHTAAELATAALAVALPPCTEPQHAYGPYGAGMQRCYHCGDKQPTAVLIPEWAGDFPRAGTPRTPAPCPSPPPEPSANDSARPSTERDDPAGPPPMPADPDRPGPGPRV